MPKWQRHYKSDSLPVWQKTSFQLYIILFTLTVGSPGKWPLKWRERERESAELVERFQIGVVSRLS